MRIIERGRGDSPIEIVVPTADADGSLVERCLSSVRKSFSSELHLVIVENHGPSFSFPASINAGVDRTSSDVLVLNDDAWLAGDAISELQRARRRLGEGVYQLYVHDGHGRPHDIGWRLDSSLLGPLIYAATHLAPFSSLRKLANGTMLPIFYQRVPRPGFDGFSFAAT